MKEINKNLFLIPILLPGNPLKCLNSYLVKGEPHTRNLLIDTGFNTDECYSTIIDAFKNLNINPSETDVFLTHLHSDHAGNAAKLAEIGCQIFMGSTDYNIISNENWAEIKRQAAFEGMPSEMIVQIFDKNPATIYSPGKFFANTVNNGDVLNYGEYSFTCICTPGHTPGHMCLYDKEAKTLLSGDHILFDISPNITRWAGFEDSLGKYMESLRKMKSIDAVYVLPGHRSCGSVSLNDRIDYLLNHHKRRLDEILHIIGDVPGMTAYDITGKIKWRIRARSWDEFPIVQKWFAMGETMAHLDYLVIRGMIQKRIDSATSCITYYID